jgi:hypothetical protein
MQGGGRFGWASVHWFLHHRHLFIRVLVLLVYAFLFSDAPFPEAYVVSAPWPYLHFVWYLYFLQDLMWIMMIIILMIGLFGVC